MRKQTHSTTMVKTWKKRFKNSNDEMFDNQKIWLNECWQSKGKRNYSSLSEHAGFGTWYQIHSATGL